MKNKESTSSILDNIRKKMQKIEETNVSEHIELGDEFNYVDKASMQADTKKIADNIISDSTKKAEEDNAVFNNKIEDDAAKTTIENNFASENTPTPLEPGTPIIDNKNEYPSVKKDDFAALDKAPKNAIKHDDIDDLDLSDLDDFEEEDHTENTDKKDDLDDLDLDDLDDLHDEPQNNSHEDLYEAAKVQPTKQEAPAPTAPIPAAEPKDFLDEESEEEDDDFILESKTIIDEEELEADLEHEKKIESPAPSIQSAPAVADNNKINITSNMISSKVAQEASNSIKQLLRQATPKKPDLHIDNSPAFKSGETVESMVVAMLQPKLEQWLNENLTSIVERIVASEIKKIVPRE